MQVDPARAAATIERAGKRYYFCSRGCAAKFQASPEEYLPPKSASSSHASSSDASRLRATQVEHVLRMASIPVLERVA